VFAYIVSRTLALQQPGLHDLLALAVWGNANCSFRFNPDLLVDLP